MNYRSAKPDEDAPVWFPSVPVIWNSTDGVKWTISSDPATFTARYDAGMTLFKDRLWLGTGIGGMMTVDDIQSSANGIDWVQEKQNFEKHIAAGSLVSFAGRLWIIGGGNITRGNYNKQLISSLDGDTWTTAPASQGMFPRLGHSVLEHDGKLWMMGGLNNETDPGSPIILNDVWNSPDGFNWSLVDANPGWGPRKGQVAVSFKGRLWVMGGYVLDKALNTNNWLTDIWYLDTP